MLPPYQLTNGLSLEDIRIIHKLFAATSVDAVVLIIFLGLVALLLLGSFGVILRTIVPGLMTSLGIFGTFWGVIIALKPYLLGKAVPNAELIPLILQGMTAAFVTSLLGLLFAIFSKAIWSTKFFIMRDTRQAQENIADRLHEIKLAITGDSHGSLLNQIQELHQDSRKGHNTNATILAEVKESISGSTENSLVSELQGLRRENADGISKLEGLADTIEKTLAASIVGLTQKIEEMVGEVLTKSIDKLIKSINKALIDQFGATFVQFNEAVQALKKWQEDHRKHVEELTVAFRQAATGIVAIQQACSGLPATADKLREIVELAQGPIDKLADQLKEYADLGDRAKAAFPTIKDNLDTIGQNLQKSAESFSELKKTIKEMFDESKAEAKNYVLKVNELASEMQKTMDQTIQDIMNNAKLNSETHSQHVSELATRMCKEVSSSLQDVMKGAVEISKAHTASVTELTANMRNTMKETQEESARKVQALVDEAFKSLMEQTNAEMNRIATKWGNEMLSIADALASATNAVRNQSSGRS